MKLFAQILLIAVCAYVASGVSVSSVVGNVESVADNVANEADKIAHDAVDDTKNVASSIFHKIQNFFHHHSNDSNVPTVDTCYSNYNAQLSSINDATVSQSQSCYAVAQNSSENIVENVNSSYAEVVSLSQSLQAQLAQCDSVASEKAAFSCFVATFDSNLKNLDDLTIQSQLAKAYLDGYQSEIEITQSGCISTVIFSSKANSTIALNTLENCLDNVSNTASGSSSSSSSDSSSGSSSSSSASSSSSSSDSSSSSSSSSSSGSAPDNGNIQVQIF